MAFEYVGRGFHFVGFLSSQKLDPPTYHLKHSKIHLGNDRNEDGCYSMSLDSCRINSSVKSYDSSRLILVYFAGQWHSQVIGTNLHDSERYKTQVQCLASTAMYCETSCV